MNARCRKPECFYHIPECNYRDDELHVYLGAVIFIVASLDKKINNNNPCASI